MYNKLIRYAVNIFKKKEKRKKGDDNLNFCFREKRYSWNVQLITSIPIERITLIIRLSGIKAIIREYMEILRNISSTQFIDSFL